MEVEVYGLHGWASKQAANDPYFCCFVSVHEMLNIVFTYEAKCTICQVCIFGPK
jgi:hypothetical protein